MKQYLTRRLGQTETSRASLSLKNPGETSHRRRNTPNSHSGYTTTAHRRGSLQGRLPPLGSGERLKHPVRGWWRRVGAPAGRTRCQRVPSNTGPLALNCQELATCGQPELVVRSLERRTAAAGSGRRWRGLNHWGETHEVSRVIAPLSGVFHRVIYRVKR